MAINTLLNYNRSANNISRSGPFSLIPGTPLLLAEFGLFVPQSVNFIELISTVGWEAFTDTVGPGLQSEISFFITQDNVVVFSTHEEAPGDPVTIDGNLSVTTSFQGVLTNVATGHHVYRLFVQNLEPTQNTNMVIGPVTISGKVIGPEA